MDKTIYVVEDNDDIRELVSYLLETEGYKVAGFANATTFKEQISNTIPDVIVLDIMLPDGNGINICNKLKLTPVTAHSCITYVCKYKYCRNQQRKQS